MDHLLAAVDLGSNSFRLSIGRVVQEDGVAQIYQIDRLKETVRLAAGLGQDKILANDAIDRAVSVLERFGERLRSFHPNRVRAVATNTFRVARNTADFLPRAEAALGFPIEVIAGREEARLIFTGVAHSLPPSANKRLVIDIGGGSTEVIIGKGFEPGLMSSLYMGCVSYSRQFFPDGRVDGNAMKQAEIAARREIEVISRQYRKTGWKEAYGSSGTAKALFAILTECGFAPAITAAGMAKLKDRIIRSGKVVPAELPGIKLERADVLPGGLAIMSALFDELGIETMHTGDGALRLGVLHDLIGRDDEHDKRDESVRQFMKRYHIDVNQARRVRQTALALFDELMPAGPERAELRNAIGWVADLHEVGLSIAHNAYHKHSAYVLENADMPGFSQADQRLMAMLALAHQGKLAKAEPLVRSRGQWIAILCLRMAVLLMRRREDTPLPFTLHVQGTDIQVDIAREWLDSHPLTDFTLRGEVSEWGKVGFSFALREH
ncbi:exopolyphosphatase [Bordetella avium]|uniref:Exopolyphosphatase n=1 Tax=Bordetella avium (strain 197N) TaxID=360910 RepID=Q2KVQ1_BORA1|nr:exopolyphosphatase [Bordetella avium]AZY48446.1 exopolyphosphatase [Bordetella avium]AZY51825.1 exopolyphosphatase [Bordetella avium]RIQ13310.1 exopolyphosphatase [Bordetella avium]RIQ16436.1 exopolyphosphatase [Bordetella avium]RIQ31122.1 exopolyphosphatase [Bordetella avium]